MKTIKYIQYVLSLVLVMSSCTNFDWDVNHETVLSTFSIGETQLDVVVTSENKTEIQTLEWAKSHAEDYSMVFYNVQFSSTEDFSQVFHTIETKNIGNENFIKLSNDGLNQIAEKAGVKQETTGIVYWKVQASNGVTTLSSVNSGQVRITRPLGYAYNPTELFLMGTATTAGDDYGKAIPLRMVAAENESGIFEIFASLKEGYFYFVERQKDKTYRRFAIDGSKLTDGNGVSSQPLEKNRIHRIRIDFNRASTSIAKISKVELWYDATKEALGAMEQEKSDIPVWTVTAAFTALNNNYKYKFRVTEVDAEGDSKQVYWGYQKETALEQNASSTADYFYAYPVDDTSSYCYRFNKKSHNGQNLTVELDMQAAGKWYTHRVAVGQ